MMSKSTILIESMTRERLKEIGRKGQSYDQLINHLLDIKKRDSPDRRFAIPQSGEFESQ
jgi:predicted CopG family antitoxin